MEEYIAKTMRLKILFIQQIAKNLKIKRANPAKKDLPFMKNDITTAELTSEIKIHCRVPE